MAGGDEGVNGGCKLGGRAHAPAAGPSGGNYVEWSVDGVKPWSVLTSSR